MAKQGVVPDELTKPFWDAANEGRLVIIAVSGGPMPLGGNFTVWSATPGHGDVEG
jgi:hypothetical protein